MPQPIRLVDGLVATDETGSPVAVMPVRIVDGLVATDEIGNPVPVLPVRIVEGPDPVPPGEIDDLSVASTTTTSAQLAFTNAPYATSHQYSLDGGAAFTLASDKIVTGLDPDETYDVEVRGVNSEGNGEWSNVAEIVTQAVPVDPPTNTSAPTISGAEQVGETLTADPGEWTNNPDSYAYQWQRNDGGWTNISGATSSTYLLDKEDEGLTVRVRVIAFNDGGDGDPAYSDATGEIEPVEVTAPVNTAVPAITGSPTVGQTLTLSNGSWNNDPTSYARQWYRDEVAISGATGSSYVLIEDDEDAEITGGVIATNAGGSSDEAISDPVGPVVAIPEADFLVTNDTEFATANTNATAGQIIQLQDSGTFTDLVLTNKTGVTVRGQTPGVPTILSFRCHGATGAYITGFKIKPVTEPTGAPKLLSLTDNGSDSCDGVVVDGIIIECGNPWDSFAPFDPTVTDTTRMGTTGNWSASNPIATELWYGIGTDTSVSGSIPSGDITIKNCVISDTREAIKFTYGGYGGLRVLNNTIIRPYQDFIAFGLAHYSGPVTHLEICGNEGYDSFAQPQDNLNPHGDFFQFFSDDIPPDLYEMPLNGLLIAGNVHWYNPGARGQAQRVFVSEFVDGYPAIAPIVIDNLLVSRITNKGVVVDAVDMDQSGSVWGYIARNTIVANPQHNTPMQNEVYTNSVSGIGASSGAAVASINVRNDPLYPDAMNYIADNVTESIIAHDSHILKGNVSLGRGSNATSYGANAIPTTSGEWDALASAEDYFDAFDATAGKGVGLAGSSMAAIRAAWSDPDNRPWASVPSWVGWRDQTGVPLDDVVTTEWAFVHAGGPGGSRSLAITGGEYQLADDHEGDGAGSWTSSSGTVAHGQYMRVRQTSPNEELTEGTVTITIGSDVLTWNVQTESTAEYAIVAFDGSDRFVRSGVLGSDNRYCTIGFKMKFPDWSGGAPGSNVDIFTSLNSSSVASSAGVRVILLTTGLLRIVHYNSSASSISTLNMNGSSLCDGGIHEVLISVDLDQSNAANGRDIWVDGVDRTVVTSSGWSGGSGVTIAYSRSTGAVGYSFGGANGNMLNGFEVQYFYLNITERADVTSSGVRSLFDASAIGADGSGVTGNQPHTFLTGIASQWNAGGGINWGSATKYIAASGSAVTDVSGDPWP